MKKTAIALLVLSGTVLLTSFYGKHRELMIKSVPAAGTEIHQPGNRLFQHMLYPAAWTDSEQQRMVSQSVHAVL